MTRKVLLTVLWICFFPVMIVYAIFSSVIASGIVAGQAVSNLLDSYGDVMIDTWVKEGERPFVKR